jgi:hypothetical protein
MLPGNVFQQSEFDSELLRSGEFQLISITLDATAALDSATKIPKGTLLCTSTSLSDGTYNVLSTAANFLAATATQFMNDVVVLAETILDASAGDQPVKAYWAGTFDLAKLTYSNKGTTTLTLAQWAAVQRIKIVGGPDA